MKKHILTLIAAVGVAFGASAESTLLNNEDNEAYLGARIGVDVTSTSNANIGTYSNGAGFHLGAIYNIPVWQNLYVEPGLSIFYDTFGEQIFTLPDTGVLDASIRNFGFRIPITAGYFFDFTDDVRIAPFTGPQLNVSLSAKQHVLGQSESIFGEGGFKHADLQWVFGVSGQWQRYYLSISGGVGITRILSTKAVHYNRNTVAITLGYNF